MKLIKTLYGLSKVSGILALENERSRKVLLVRSTDVLESLSRILKEVKSRNKKYKDLRKDYRSLEIKLLDTDNTRMTFQYYVEYYKSLGYTFYTSYTAVRYAVRIEIDPEYHVIVKLRSKGNYEITLGLFDTIEDAESFVSYSYPDGRINAIVYALNERSRVYFRSRV